MLLLLASLKQRGGRNKALTGPLVAGPSEKSQRPKENSNDLVRDLGYSRIQGFIFNHLTQAVTNCFCGF